MIIISNGIYRMLYVHTLIYLPIYKSEAFHIVSDT